MNWLLWKEYRLNRLIVFVTLFLMIFPHLIMIYISWWNWFRGVATGLQRWQEYLAISAIYGLVLSQAGLALIGGNVIAGERADRSAEFQAYLPLTRRKILAAKLLVALAIACMIWLTNPPLFCLFAFTLGFPPGWGPGELRILGEIFFNVAITGLTFFCVAWLFSSILRSATFSVSAGLLTPLLAVSGIAFIAYLLDIQEAPQFTELYYRSFCLVVSPLCFAVGTWLFLRRREP